MMKKAASVLLAVLLCLNFAACGKTGAPEAAAPAEEETAASAAETAVETPEWEPERVGTDDLTWEFDAASGTLSVHGEGPMREYAAEAPEWEQHIDAIREVTLDDGITSVGAYAFCNYSRLEKVTLPDSIEVIDVSAFDYDWALREITIPASLAYVGDRAFYNTLLWLPEDLVFPEGCVYIGDEAFHSALKSGGTVTLPASLEYLGNQSFTNAVISDFIIAGGNETYCVKDHAVYTKDGKELRMLAPCGEALGEFRIPDGTERIAGEAFNAIRGIETIHIPASVTQIAEAAFFSTFDLKEIVVDEANPNYKSEDGLLLSKDGTLLLAWPDGKGGSELVIPDGVERLGGYLFYGRFDEGCTVVIPEGVKELGTMCLPAQIASLTLPATLEAVDPYVFYDGISIAAVSYNGTAADWDAIAFENGNEGLDPAVLSVQ